MNNNLNCEIPDLNPADEKIMKLLKAAKKIAIIGLSDNPERDSYRVGKYLKEHGYIIVPVNPAKKQILGEKAYPDLITIPFKIDIVDIFRNVEAIPGIVDESIQIKPMAVWMQLGLAHKESAEKARRAGIEVIQSKCIKIEHSRLEK